MGIGFSELSGLSGEVFSPITWVFQIYSFLNAPLPQHRVTMQGTLLTCFQKCCLVFFSLSILMDHLASPE